MTKHAMVLLISVSLSLGACDFISKFFPTEEKAVQDAYFAYRKALQAGDIPSLKNLIAREKAMDLEKEGAEQMIELLKSFSQYQPTVAATAVSGDKATLAVQTEFEVGILKGEVNLVKEDGRWKLFHETWDMMIHPKPVTLSGGEKAPAFEPLDPSLISPGLGYGMGTTGTSAWDRSNPPRQQATIKGHEGEVTGLTFTPDGGFLISVSYGDFTVRMWNASDWSEVSAVKLQHRPTGMDISPDGSLLLITDAYENITFLPIDIGKLGEPQRIDANVGKSSSVAISPNGRLFATATFDKFAIIGNLQSRNSIRRVETPEPLRGATFSPSGELLAASTTSNKFMLWNLREGKGRTYTVSKVNEKSDMGTIAFSPDGKRFATGHMDSSITLWEVEHQKELYNFFVPNASTWVVRFSPDGKLLATGHADNRAYLWDASTSQKVATLTGHTAGVRSISFSPDGSTLATGGEDKTIIIWK